MKNNSEVQPFSLPTAIAIIIACTLLDTVGAVVLLIGAFIFMKMGHKGLAITMGIINCIAPDSVPFVDEIFTIVTVIVPIYQSYCEGKSFPETMKSIYSSCKGYKNMSNTSSNNKNLTDDIFDDM